VYSAVPATAVTIDGQPATMEFNTIFGWQFGSCLVVVPAGKDVHVHLDLAGSIQPGPYVFTTRVPPIAGRYEMVPTVESP
jgi:hypothetical protein